MNAPALWRDDDPEVFRGTILAAAERLDVQPLAVEKDYWVCEALRAITTEHPGEVVFKGGTSLEKLRIIRRFSEDLDLLVIGQYPSKNAEQRALRTLLASAAEATGSEPTGVTAGGNSGSFHRSGYLSPPLEHRGEPGAIANPAAILVELGQSGGPNPHALHPVTSLLARELADSGFDTSAWADLASFDVPILHPGRTLLEKLLRVNNFAASPDTAASPHGWPRIGRQLYDIYSLLLDPTVRELLTDKPLVADILTSARDVSAAFGRPDLPAPIGGFAASPAFDPASSFADRLRTEHDAAMRHLYYGMDAPPSFDDILAQVRADAALLDP
ncbi:nucleotidyl transferase AbiEii/AbiGii toxin family protein [Compostimonas suwonensis]|uniref:Nucleotidyltransferase AbiEii toxin of type IV toxin-antitoxin system n=1 Tax=Compostimonas suwonensis TaxID=1048394 RepID=A0A2M9BBI7_9MICO|nr:nucleotidyl transferase AbiEii/AbiGii toxin family protein [Compostimonas suwonensis]PJJ55307.1 nucleotidyltransferase AbiEii toxin of type IV toxin-antitoxin system [Compostimonas suwonensis]